MPWSDPAHHLLDNYGVNTSTLPLNLARLHPRREGALPAVIRPALRAPRSRPRRYMRRVFQIGTLIRERVPGTLAGSGEEISAAGEHSSERTSKTAVLLGM